MFDLKKTTLMLSLLTSIFLNLSVHAAEKVLATISNDENKKTYQLVVDSNESDSSIRVFYKDIFSEGKKLSREILDYKVLIKNGMILEQRDKYVVLKLKSENFDEEQGGIITVDTLYNGANGTRKEYEIELTKDKNDWVLVKGGKTVKQIFIESNKVMMLGTVGIKNLVMK